MAGERLDPPTYHWLNDMLPIPVIDHWWQTETGWPMCANMAGIELMQTKPGSPTLPVPGYDLRILDDDGEPVGPNVEGNVVVKGPLPPGALPTVWGDHERYVESYWSRFPGFYLTGDGGYLDEDGYLYVMGRIDDVINVAGHRLSTGAMEEVVASHPAVAECAVIGIEDADRGQVPLGLLLLKDGANIDEAALQTGTRRNGAALDRCVRQLQTRGGRQAAAQDALRKDSPTSDAQDGRQTPLYGAVYHRRSGHPEGNRGHAPRSADHGLISARSFGITAEHPRGDERADAKTPPRACRSAVRSANYHCQTPCTK